MKVSPCTSCHFERSLTYPLLWGKNFPNGSDSLEHLLSEMRRCALTVSRIEESTRVSVQPQTPQWHESPVVPGDWAQLGAPGELSTGSCRRKREMKLENTWKEWWENKEKTINLKSKARIEFLKTIIKRQFQSQKFIKRFLHLFKSFPKLVW